MNKQTLFTLGSLIGTAVVANGAVISVLETGTLEPERSIVENGGAGVFDGTHPGTNAAAGSLFFSAALALWPCKASPVPICSS